MSKFKTAAPTGTAENPMVVLKRLLRYLKPYRLRLAVVFLCMQQAKWQVRYPCHWC